MNPFNLIPFALAYIMFVLGLQLKLSDFNTIKRQPKAVLVGLFSQMVMVPAVAYTLLRFFPLDPQMQFGIMLLSFCAGGATSNLLSFYAGGNLALSVCLTALTSLLSMFTLPFLVGITYPIFLSGSVDHFNATSLILKMLVLSTAPIIVGMLIRRYAENFVNRFIGGMQKVVNILFALLVVAAVAANWSVMVKQFSSVGLLVLVMAFILLWWGRTFSKVLGLDASVQKTIGIETGIQNGAMGIALAPFIMPATMGGLPALAVPSAVYGVLMNLIILPYVWWCHTRMKR